MRGEISNKFTEVTMENAHRLGEEGRGFLFMDGRQFE